jgi:hypothetical protein
MRAAGLLACASNRPHMRPIIPRPRELLPAPRASPVSCVAFPPRAEPMSAKSGRLRPAPSRAAGRTRWPVPSSEGGAERSAHARGRRPRPDPRMRNAQSARGGAQRPPRPCRDRTQRPRTTARRAPAPRRHASVVGGVGRGGVVRGCYLVDPASSHMLVSKIKPCMCKYELIQTVKLRMAH